MKPAETLSFTTPFLDCLRTRYDEDIVDQLTGMISHAPIPEIPGESIRYIRLNPGVGDRTIVYIPGFSENLVTKMALGCELASQGKDVIIPGQSRGQVPKDLRNTPYWATRAQAYGNMAVLAAEGMDEKLNVLSHSYGSLIACDMSELAADKGTPYFGESHVVMCAPAGMIEEESFLSLTRRALRTRSEENAQADTDLPELVRFGRRTHEETIRANKRRTFRECQELAGMKLDYARMVREVGSLTMVVYAEDSLFPYELLEPALKKAAELGIPYTVPVQWERPDGRRRQRGSEAATHDDESFHPSRVAGAVLGILNSKQNHLSLVA